MALTSRLASALASRARPLMGAPRSSAIAEPSRPLAAAGARPGASGVTVTASVALAVVLRLPSASRVVAGGLRVKLASVTGGDGEARQVPAVHVDRGVAGAGGECVSAVAEHGAGRNGADLEACQRIGIAGEAVDGGAEIERDGGAFEAARGGRGEAGGERGDGDGLGGARGGAEIALGIAGDGGGAEGEIGVVYRGDGEARQVPAVHVDRGVAGAGGECVSAVAEHGAGRNGADLEACQRIGIAGEAVDGGAEIERDGGAFEAARGGRGEAGGERGDGDGLGGARGGAEIALGIPRGGGGAEGEIGVVYRGDGEARQVPAVHVDRGVAAAGGECVSAVAEHGAGRNGADHEGGDRVGVAGEAVDGGAEIERDGGAFEAARGGRGEAGGQRGDGDGLGGARGGAEIAL